MQIFLIRGCRMLMKRCLLTVLIAGVVLSATAQAGDSDAFLTQLADSPLLTPRFSHLDSVSTLDLGDRDASGSSVPTFQAEQRRDPRRSTLTKALSIEWQHTLNAGQRLSMSAQYSDQINADNAALAGTGSAATFGMQQQLGRDSQLAGQLFLGDEGLKSRVNGYGARRYYGLLFEGRTSLWRDHTPFASLSWQRNDYEGLDGNGLLPGSSLRSDSISRLGAGWAWQVTPGFDVRAEAQYRLSDEPIDPAEQDRLQFFFRSRYGFR